MYKQAWLAGALRAMSQAGLKAPLKTVGTRAMRSGGTLATAGKPMSMFTVPAIGAGIGGVATPLLHEDTFYDKLTGNTGASFGDYLQNMAIGAGAGFGVQGLSKLGPVKQWAFNASRNPARARMHAANMTRTHVAARNARAAARNARAAAPVAPVAAPVAPVAAPVAPVAAPVAPVAAPVAPVAKRAPRVSKPKPAAPMLNSSPDVDAAYAANSYGATNLTTGVPQQALRPTPAVTPTVAPRRNFSSVGYTVPLLGLGAAGMAQANNTPNAYRQYSSY